MPICRGELSFSNRSGSAGRALSILPGCMSRLHIFARLVFAYVSEPTISSVSRAISSGGIADGRSVEPAAAGFACGLGKSLRMISLVRNGGHRAIWPVGNAQTFFLARAHLYAPREIASRSRFRPPGRCVDKGVGLKGA